MRWPGSCRPWTPGIWHNCNRWCADGCDRGSPLFPELAAIGQKPGRKCSAGRSVDSTCTTCLHLPIGGQDGKINADGPFFGHRSRKVILWKDFIFIGSEGTAFSF